MGWVMAEVQHSCQTRSTPPGSEHAPKWAAQRLEGLGLCHFTVSPGVMSAVLICAFQSCHSLHHACFSIATSPVPGAVGTQPLEPPEPSALAAQALPTRSLCL